MSMAPYQPLIEAMEKALDSLTPSDCPELAGQLERLKTMVLGRMLLAGSVKIPQAAETAVQYLSVEQAAEKFNVTPRWLYRNKKKLPHSQPSRKKLLFPEQPLRKWFAARKSC
jgi:hypothetical protein